MKKDEQLYCEYDQTLEQYTERCYVSEVEQESTDRDEQQWFLSYFWSFVLKKIPQRCKLSFLLQQRFRGPTGVRFR